MAKSAAGNGSQKAPVLFVSAAPGDLGGAREVLAEGTWLKHVTLSQATLLLGDAVRNQASPRAVVFDRRLTNSRLRSADCGTHYVVRCMELAVLCGAPIATIGSPGSHDSIIGEFLRPIGEDRINASTVIWPEVAAHLELAS
ncbi:MAG: hypothetical protein WCO52_00925 [bacterium]